MTERRITGAISATVDAEWKLVEWVVLHSSSRPLNVELCRCAAFANLEDWFDAQLVRLAPLFDGVALDWDEPVAIDDRSCPSAVVRKNGEAGRSVALVVLLDNDETALSATVSTSAGSGVSVAELRETIERMRPTARTWLDSRRAANVSSSVVQKSKYTDLARVAERWRSMTGDAPEVAPVFRGTNEELFVLNDTLGLTRMPFIDDPWPSTVDRAHCELAAGTAMRSMIARGQLAEATAEPGISAPSALVHSLQTIATADVFVQWVERRPAGGNSWGLVGIDQDEATLVAGIGDFGVSVSSVDPSSIPSWFRLPGPATGGFEISEAGLDALLEHGTPSPPDLDDPNATALLEVTLVARDGQRVASQAAAILHSADRTWIMERSGDSFMCEPATDSVVRDLLIDSLEDWDEQARSER